jgi:integrase
MAKKMKGVTSRQRNGTTYWYAMVDGRRVYCGKNEKGRKLAVKARQKYEVKRYENREVNAGLKVKRTTFRTVTDLSNWYMTRPAIQEQKSYGRKTFLAANLLEFFGKKPANCVEADDMEDYRRHRRGQGAMDGTVDLELSLLSAMYNMARKRGKMPADAVPGDFVLKQERNPRKIIPDDTFEAIVKAADKDFADVLVCGHETAMRSSEIVSLTASQVHLDKTVGIAARGRVRVDYIHLGLFDTKTGAERIIPVSPRLKAVLKRRLKGLDPDELVFTNTYLGKQRRYHDANQICVKMKAACKAAGVIYGDKALNDKGERIGVTFHCLRHTRTTKWVEAGFSDEIVRRDTVHSTLEAYKNYVKINDPRVMMRLVEGDDSELRTNGTKAEETLTASGSKV